MTINRLEEMARLSAWTPRQPIESLHSYGARVLQHLIACAVTAPLSDEDLELAEHVAVLAVASHDISPTALEALNRTRHLIASILKGRRADAYASLPAVKPDDRPNLGPMAKLQPVPAVQPPSGQRVDFAF